MNEWFVIGILVSLFYMEITDLSPGGIIVPAYFILYLHDPARIGITLVLSLLCLGIMRLLSHVMILYGRRRFAMYVVVSILLKFLAGYLYQENLFHVMNLSLSIGYLIPGLIGRDMERQGIFKTCVSLGIVVLILRLMQILSVG